MNRWHRGLRATLFSLLGLTLACGSAHAAVYTGNSSTGYDANGVCTTIGTDNGDFADARNWGSPCQSGSVPGGGATADLNGHGVHGTAVSVSTLITNGGSLTADSIKVTNLTLNKGSINGRSATASTLSVSSVFNWTDGVLSALSATLGAKCTTTISGDYDSSGSGSGSKSIQSDALVKNLGVINWSGASITGVGGTLNNAGVFKMNADGAVGTGSAGLGIVFINTGTFTKAGGTGETTIGFGNGFFNNGGTLQARSGIFDPSVAYGNNTTLTTGSIIATGGGVVRQSFPWKIDGTIKVNGTFRLTTSENSGKATFTGPGKIDWKSGGFYPDPSVSAIVFAPDMHVMMNGTGVKVLGNISNQGILTWTGGTTSGILKNSGTFNLLNDGDISGLGLINTGTFAKTGGSGKIITGNHSIDNSGIVDVKSGILQLDANPNSGSDIFRNGTVIQGAGKIVDYTPAKCDGTVTVNTVWQLDDATSGNAAIIGPVTLTGSGLVNWLGGLIDGVTIAKGFTLNISGSYGKSILNNSNTGTPLVNAGTLNWKGGATVNQNTGGSAFINNTGTFNVLASGYFLQGRLVNRGTLNTYAGTSKIFPQLLNYSVLNLGNATKPGILQIAGNDGESFHNYGTINAFVSGSGIGKFSQIQALSNGNVVTNLVLGGTLALKIDPNFTPDASFQILFVKIIPDRAFYNGTFATVSGLPTVGGRAFKLFYNSLDVTLGFPFILKGRTSRTLPSTSVQGIAGSTITLQPSTGSALTTTSDANGYFNFAGLQLGAYTVSASNGSIVFDPTSKKVVFPVTDGPDASVLFQTYAVVAKIVDAKGAAVAGAEITLTGNRLSHTVATDASGVALFGDLGLATYTLTPSEQSDFSFAPAKGTVKLPTAGIAGQSPNGFITFTRKAKVNTITVPSSSAHSG